VPSSRRRCGAGALWFAAAAALVLLTPAPAEAYIGPGAGFVLLSSILTFVATIFLALLALVLWPFRKAWRIFRPVRRGPAFARRLIVVGLDGQDAGLTERLMTQGKLPVLKTLAEIGGYRRLRATSSSESPSVWSWFSTGADPGKDNASKPFWCVLGEHGIWSTILRVPITDPPDKFHGAQLSAMSVPDLRGTNGTFTLLTTRPTEGQRQTGLRIPLEFKNDRALCELPGPENSFMKSAPALRVRLAINLIRPTRAVRVEADGASVVLQPGRMSDWIPMNFGALPGVKISGICRLLLLEMDDHVSLYVTPINIDPDKPARPIAYPRYYATYLAKRVGRFATLGFAEDTRALNEGVIGVGDFVRQAYDVDREREAIFFAGLDRLRSGALVCVFDCTDRVQHVCGPDTAEIEKLYRHNDALVGRIMATLRPDDLFLVLSGHGFAANSATGITAESPGILFSNRKIDSADPGLVDIAPTVLRTFGVTPLPQMGGASLFDFAASTAGRARGVAT